MASETEIPRERVFCGDICEPDTGDLRKAMEGVHALVIATSAGPKLKASSLFGVRSSSRLGAGPRWWGTVPC